MIRNGAGIPPAPFFVFALAPQFLRNYTEKGKQLSWAFA